MNSKISREAAEAFVACRPFRRMKKFMSGEEGGTEVIISKSGKFIEMYLHGNCIAEWNIFFNVFRTTLAGYNTKTTKARLNALLQAMYDKGLLKYDSMYSGTFFYSKDRKHISASDWQTHVINKEIK